MGSIVKMVVCEVFLGVERGGGVLKVLEINSFFKTSTVPVSCTLVTQGSIFLTRLLFSYAFRCFYNVIRQSSG